MTKEVIVDPGPIVVGPGKGEPPAFGKIEIHDGWPSKWVSFDDALKSDNLSDEAFAVVSLLADPEEVLDGLLLPAVQAARGELPLTFNKVTEQDFGDLAAIADDFVDFDNVVFLDPGGTGGSGELQHKVEWGTFIKIGDIKGESQDVEDMGAWSPLSDFDLV